MQTSSSTQFPSLSTSKSATALWTARLVATLWKLAVKRARKLRRRSQGDADQSNIVYGSAISPTSEDLDETSIMHEAALSVVASGVVSLADLEAVTGFRLSKIEVPPAKDDDENSDAATDTSDSCSVAGSDLNEGIDEEFVAVSPVVKRVEYRKPLQHSVSQRKSAATSRPARWVCVGYGRYRKVQECTPSEL